MAVLCSDCTEHFFAHFPPYRYRLCSGVPGCCAKLRSLPSVVTDSFVSFFSRHNEIDEHCLGWTSGMCHEKYDE